MTTFQTDIPVFNYLSGKDFTEKLRIVTETTTNYQLADKFGIPRSTIQTWHSHDRTAFELIIRAHLATGASVRYMALGEGEPFPKDQGTVAPTNSFDKFQLFNGKLEKVGTAELGLSTLNDFGLSDKDVIVIEKNDCQQYINKAETQPASGDYLLDIDGVLSVNYLQRLPGKKLAIAFEASTIEVSEEDIKVVGRVAMEMRKK